MSRPPILFLDIDGVLNSARYFSADYDGADPDGMTWEEAQIDPAAVAILNRILNETGAGVVVSSAWRLLHSLDEIEAILRARGLDANVEFLGKTPDLGGRPRGEEIQDWIDIHETWIDHVGPVCILDDDADMAHLSHRLVRTSFSLGLTDAEADRAIAMLRGAP